MDLDEHVLLEDACLHGDAGGAEGIGKRGDERLRGLGRSSVGEAGAAALARAAVESELAHYERLTGNVEKRQVELTCLIGEYPQVGDPLGQVAGISFRVALAHTEEDHQPVADGSNEASFNTYGGSRDPLYQGSQWLSWDAVAVVVAELFASGADFASAFVSALASESPSRWLWPSRSTLELSVQ